MVAGIIAVELEIEFIHVAPRVNRPIAYNFACKSK